MLIKSLVTSKVMKLIEREVFRLSKIFDNCCNKCNYYVFKRNQYYDVNKKTNLIRGGSSRDPFKFIYYFKILLVVQSMICLKLMSFSVGVGVILNI